MAVTIETQPVESRQAIEYAHSFSVSAIGTDGPLRYQWYVGGSPVEGATQRVFRPVATVANTGKNVKVVLRDDSSVEVSDTVKMWSTTPNEVFDPDIPSPQEPSGYEGVTKHSLLWNFKNDTFTWKDPTTEQPTEEGFAQYDIDSQVYAFLPGFQQRWEDYTEGAVLEMTWENAGNLSWFQTFSKGKDKEMLVVSNGHLFKAEKQRNRPDSHKQYFVERTQLDFDGLSPEFRSGKVKQTKRFIFDIQGDQRMVSEDYDSKVDMYVGWSMNLMAEPNYKKTAVSFDLQATDFGGSYKVDYRSTGRYMGMYFDMTEANQLSFTGGEIDVSQTSGR